MAVLQLVGEYSAFLARGTRQGERGKAICALCGDACTLA